MATISRAKPTEFGGVTFRSKSEAFLAVGLFQVPQLIWVYEPSLKGFTFDVDFLCTVSTGKKAASFLLEYKPSKPSEQYIEKCIEDFTAFCSRTKNDPYECLGFWIVWGSPFENVKLESLAIHMFVNERGIQSDDWAAMMLEENGWDYAKQHRFDLA